MNCQDARIPLLSRGGADATSIKYREATLMERTGWFGQPGARVAFVAKARPRVSKTTTDAELFTILRDMVSVTDDYHIDLLAGWTEPSAAIRRDAGPP
jgi:hypothetical protein